jgi:hypothetical protein
MADRQGGGQPAGERTPRFVGFARLILQSRAVSRGVPVPGPVRVLPWTGRRASGLSGGRIIIFPGYYFSPPIPRASSTSRVLPSKYSSSSPTG